MDKKIGLFEPTTKRQQRDTITLRLMFEAHIVSLSVSYSFNEASWIA